MQVWDGSKKRVISCCMDQPTTTRTGRTNRAICGMLLTTTMMANSTRLFRAAAMTAAHSQALLSMGNRMRAKKVLLILAAWAVASRLSMPRLFSRIALVSQL
jgi:hypothetical protein